MAQSYFPLRWESTGDQWWYASPIDWAAANGHYDLVRELLHLDTNLLIKLTSLRRIRRLETVWDDDSRFIDAAKCRSHVARNLLLECEMKNRRNSLIRAGYGGWLLYTAASAGDMAFVRELLERDPLLVFGEGEFGVTDIFYAASRSKNTDVFRLIFDFALSPRCSIGGGGAGEIKEGPEGNASVFRWEMVNRALHATSRGGNLEILRELLDECSDILAYRDVQGSTILHAASARGQVEVVKYLIAFYTIINSTDNQGSTALHVAAYRGHPPIVEAITRTCPSSSSLTNNSGDTFLHAAVAGFRAPGFRRLDRQMELMKQLVSGIFLNIKEIINIPNNDGRTALHMALIGNMHSDLVELLMTIPSIDLNIRDANGMTPLDILSQRPRSALSEILIKQLISAGGLFNSKDFIRGSAIASQLKLQVVGNSPGTSFKVSDAEIFLYTGIGASEDSGRPSSCSTSKSELTHYETINQNHDLPDKKQNAVNNAARRLKIFLRWPRHRENKAEARRKLTDDDSVESLKKWCERKDTPPTPLRQRFSKVSASLPNNKRVLSVRNSMPSPAMKKKFASGLMHGVMQAMPHLAPQGRSPSTTISRSSMSSSPVSEKQKGICLESEEQKGICLESEAGGASCSSSSVNTRNRNHYFCFGAKGLAMDGRRSTRMFK